MKKNKKRVGINQIKKPGVERISTSKGITLIALVITIIVMAILTAIVIYLFSNQGPIEHAKMSQFATEFREIEERVELYAADKQMEKVQEQINNRREVIGNSESILPVANKVNGEEKQKIKKEKSELEVKIKQLSEKEIEEVNLYWIDQEKIGTKRKESYMIDIETGQIYQYEGKQIYGLMWHTLDSGVRKGESVTPGESDELWDGWVRLTLYYPSGSTNREWRIGEEGETRYDENLMWKEYTGPIWVRLKDVENVWIRYIINGEETVIAPAGRLAVDIQPDSYYPSIVEKVKVKIYYDKEASLKEYKIGNSGWKEYKGEFIVTENTIVEARAKKVEQISDKEGNIIGEREIWGRDNIYVGNIGIEEIELPAPNLIRKEGEIAKVEAVYPEGAQRKIYKINYGEEQEYKEEISIKEYGTYVIAYYYNTEGKRSKSKAIYIGENNTPAQDYTPNPVGPPSEDDKPSYVIPEPNISVSPSGITNQVTVKISTPSGYVADKMYYKIGEGNYQIYTDSFTLNYNTTITAYYQTPKGERSSTARRRVSNIQEGAKPYIAIEANPDPYEVPYEAGKVKVSIINKDADKVEYSLNGITYQTYSGALEITKNCRIYAKGTNQEGITIQYLDITNLGNEPSRQDKLNVWIEVNPEPKLTNELVEKAVVNIQYDDKAQEKYYKIGDGELKAYTGSFEITENCTIYAYAVSSNGKGQTSKQIDHLTKGIAKPEIIANPGNGTRAGKVRVSINFDRTANIRRYKINNGSYMDYTGEIQINENCTITAYNKNKLGYEATSSYQITNITPTTTVVIDKGKYYLIKLNYPPESIGREYKWQDDGEWKNYQEEGILLIKPEYKEEILNASGEIKIKIEDENGKKIDFKGDYYFVTKPIQELMEHIYLRWDRTIPQAPSIILNTQEPAREVKVAIHYLSSHRKKEYKIINPDGSSKGWQEYQGSFSITKKNTIIYARGQDEAQVWSKEGIRKITNIDEEPPVIKVTADLETQSQRIGVKVEATDDTKVEMVMWAKGIRGESYFGSNGTVIQNNSIFYVNENGYYTIYAKDRVGNESTYTIQVGNVDLTPPSIQIQVTPENTIVMQVKIGIEYGDSTLKQYKIGESNTTWTNYTGEITLTSNTVIAKGWKNADNTVTVYAKGKDSAGNEKIETYKILSLDVDAASIPVITSSYGYPILTEYGVEFDGETSIRYDTRTDIENYYSLDNGATWKKYEGIFQVKTSGTIIAKSVKKASGLETIASKEIGMPADAMGPNAYDGNIDTYENCSSTIKYIEIDETLIGKSINLRVGSASFTTAYVRDAGRKPIKSSENTYGTKTITMTLPEGSKWITLLNSNQSKLYEIEVENKPVINVTQNYPKITQYGVEKGYNLVNSISYFPTSVQRLYKIDNGEWKSYEGKEIRLEIGQVIYAKGIDKGGNETNSIPSYTATLPADAMGANAYDGNIDTYENCSSTIKYIEIDETLIGKSINLRVGSASFTTAYVRDAGRKPIKSSENTYGTKTITMTLPEGSKWITLLNSNQSKLYEIEVENKPVIKITQNYPKITKYGVEKGYNLVNSISYFPTSIQRLYKIDNGEWKSYEGKEIRLGIGQVIYAKGIDKSGNETNSIPSYTATLPADAIGPNAYDGNIDTYENCSSTIKYIEIDETLIGKSINLRVGSASFTTAYVRDAGRKVIKSSENTYGTKTITMTLPEGSKWITLLDSNQSKLYEIEITK